MDKRKLAAQQNKLGQTGHLAENVRFLKSRIQQATLEFNDQGHVWMFKIPMLPPSVNHMYVQGRKGHRWLSKEYQDFKTLTALSMPLPLKNYWNGVLLGAALIVLRSPRWLTTKGEVSVIDADNRIKPLFDSIQLASGNQDQRIFEFRVFKEPFEREETAIYLRHL